jgi:hypothetical protein
LIGEQVVRKRTSYPRFRALRDIRDAVSSPPSATGYQLSKARGGTSETAST